ncbi:MAG: ribonuclease III [Okeania sp. SIO3B3]|nr:ribonuclease III [Okeania sp. SIO3B3]
MTIHNKHEIIGKALNILSKNLYPYIEDVIKEFHQENWFQVIQETLKGEIRQLKKKKSIEKALIEDVSLQLKLIKKQWDKVFKIKLDKAFLLIVEELIEVRNDWAHGSLFSVDDTYRYLDNITRILKIINAEEVKEVEKEKQEVLRLLSQQQFRGETPHSYSVSEEEERQIREQLSELLEKISFQDASLLQLALIHRTYLFENPTEVSVDNNRLEFLGDALLNFLSGEYLYRKYQKMTEGEMTQKRSSLVDNQQLAKFAIDLNLGQFILLSKGEELQGGRENYSLLSDTFEAVIGAYYIDSGIEAVRNFIEPIFAKALEKSVALEPENESLNIENPKGLFQELVLKNGTDVPRYKTEKCGGSDHEPSFISRVFVANRLYGEGQGGSKKEAEKLAAENALSKLR